MGVSQSVSQILTHIIIGKEPENLHVIPSQSLGW